MYGLWSLAQKNHFLLDPAWKAVLVVLSLFGGLGA